MGMLAGERQSGVLMHLILAILITFLWWAEPPLALAPPPTECDEMRAHLERAIPLEMWFIRNKDRFLAEGMPWPWEE